MKYRALIAIAWLASLIAPPVAAQSPKQVVPTAADQPYRHPHSGIALPTALEGIARTQAEQLGDNELDVIVNYTTPDNGEVITLFIYRDVLRAMPVWFDRAVFAAKNRSQLFGTVTPALSAAAFTPPGHSQPSGLIATWATEKSYRSTGVAMFTSGDWLVKLRYSSRSIAPEALEARMNAVLAAITLPAVPQSDRPTALVQPCTEPLAFRKKARLVRTSSDDRISAALVAGMMASTENRGNGNEAGKPPVFSLWCRDPGQAEQQPVYRADEAKDHYLIAVSDAGRGVVVRPDLSGLIRGSDRNRWGVDLVLLDRTLSFPAYSAMPTPAQALQAINGDPIVSTTTFGDKRNIELNTK